MISLSLTLCSPLIGMTKPIKPILIKEGEQHGPKKKVEIHESLNQIIEPSENGSKQHVQSEMNVDENAQDLDSELCEAHHFHVTRYSPQHNRKQCPECRYYDRGWFDHTVDIYYCDGPNCPTCLRIPLDERSVISGRRALRHLFKCLNGQNCATCLDIRGRIEEIKDDIRNRIRNDQRARHGQQDNGVNQRNTSISNTDSTTTISSSSLLIGACVVMPIVAVIYFVYKKSMKKIGTEKYRNKVRNKG